MKIKFLSAFCFVIFLLFLTDSTTDDKFNGLSITPICNEERSLIENKNDRFFNESYLNVKSNTLYEFKNNLITKQPQNINILITNTKNWYSQLDRIFNHEYVIKDEYKNYFESRVVIKNGGFLCTMNAGVRVSGDYKDHIQEKEDLYISSLEVSLNEGNLLGSRKFKLFLPETREGQNEIFVTSLMQSLDFLAPTTFYVDVNQNGLNHKYLFQEKITNDFLLRNNKKEGPIIEADTPEPYEWDKQSIDTARILNQNWLSANPANLDYGYKAIEIYSKMRVFHPNDLNEKNDNINIGLNYSFLDSYSSEKLKQFFILNIILENFHSLDLGNRKYYVDPLTDRIYPIYYDGGSQLLTSDKVDTFTYPFPGDEWYSHIVIDSSFKEAISTLKESLNLLDVKKLMKTSIDRGVDESKEEFIEKNLIKILNDRLEIISENLIDINNIENLKIEQYFKKSDKNFDKYFLMFREDNIFNYCDTSLIVCQNIQLNEIEQIQLLNGTFFIDEKKVYYIGKSLNELDKPLSKNNIFQFQINSDDVKIYSNNKIRIFSIENNTYKIYPPENTKILIMESDLENLNIEVKYEKYINNSEKNDIYRYGKTFLTGCLNIYDSNILDTNITVVNSQCEDGVNIVRSIGNVNKLEIQNSYFDAVDLDFSNLDIFEIKVTNAGNDCVDLSMGSYNLIYSDLIICGDKGISIGENSNVQIDQINIDSSNFGVAVKDSSVVNIENLNVNQTEICHAQYRKKQEFGPTKLQIKISNCNGSEILAQSDSYYEK